MFRWKKTALGIAITSALFVGYCIYFDMKRRSDPDYEKKVLERRRRDQEAREAAEQAATPVRIVYPDRNDQEALERFFLEQIDLGEQAIARRDINTAVEHFANGIGVCSQPTRVLMMMQQTMPSEVFAEIIIGLQEFGNRRRNAFLDPRLPNGQIA